MGDDVNFTIGGTPAPFISAMQKVTQSAKDGAAKVTEAFGIEGVRGERAIRGRFLSAFQDISKNGTNSAEAIGGAFSSMAEGLKLSMGSMIALLAVSELVKGLYSGYQAAGKMKDAVKDALSVNTDVTSQSVEQVQQDIKKLNDDAQSNNVAAMSSLQAGATAVVQALEEGKSISEVINEDAQEYNKLKQEAHDMQDQLGALAIEDENTVLQMRLDGHDKEAEAYEKKKKLENDLKKAQADKNVEMITQIQKQMDLNDALREKEIDNAANVKEAKLDDLRNEVQAEQMNRGSDADKLKLAQQQEEAAKTKFGDLNTKGTDPIAIEQARLEWEKSITKEKDLQKSIAQKQYDEWQKANDKDAEQKKKQEEASKKALEVAEQRTKLLQQQAEAQQAVNAAGVDASLFHGEVSSLAKTGLGGRVSGANYGNQAQLKAVQDAAKHLADIKADIKKLSGGIGIAQ